MNQKTKNIETKVVYKPKFYMLASIQNKWKKLILNQNF